MIKSELIYYNFKKRCTYDPIFTIYTPDDSPESNTIS